MSEIPPPLTLESYQGAIKKIEKAAALGGKGNFEVAMVDLQSGGEAWYPLGDSHTLESGNEVTITPTIQKYPSGGSRTTYHVDRAVPMLTAQLEVRPAIQENQKDSLLTS